MSSSHPWEDQHMLCWAMMESKSERSNGVRPVASLKWGRSSSPLLHPVMGIHRSFCGNIRIAPTVWPKKTPTAEPTDKRAHDQHGSPTLHTPMSTCSFVHTDKHMDANKCTDACVCTFACIHIPSDCGIKKTDQFQSACIQQKNRPNR